MPHRGQPFGAGVLFMAAAGLLLAHQVAGKAVRDGLFLSRFDPSDLPKVVVAAALVAVFLGLGFARLLGRFGPSRLVPIAFATGAGLHVLEFALLRGSGDAVRAIVVSVVYLHLVGFGAILLSGFWSVVNEYYDPREAKMRFGGIAGAGTVGGIVGGLLAERGAAMFGADALLLLLAALHAAAAAIVWMVPGDRSMPANPTDKEPVWRAAREAFQQAPFLVNLAVLVLLGTMSAALLDYLFKSSAAATFGKGPMLTRYFALFYAGNQVLSFAMQMFLTPLALRRLGLGRTVRFHPIAVALGAGASLVGPRALMAPVARSLELVLRGSFLRSGYELFFTPVPPREKRAVKTFIDVGCDRMGDAFGAGILQLLLLLGTQQAVIPILLVAILFSLLSMRITSRMDKAYMEVLQHGLLSRAVAVNEAEVEDSTTLSAMMNTVHLPSSAMTGNTLSARAIRRREPTLTPVAPVAGRQVTPANDAVLARLTDLRSGVPDRVAAALHAGLSYDPLIMPQAIRLLAWNESVSSARAFLLIHGARAVGQMVDALLDQEQDFAVRRRIPRILAYCSSQRAVDGLTEALADSRFEIRYHSSRALEFLHRMDLGLRFHSETVLAAVEKELALPRLVREGRRLLDRVDDSQDQSWFLDDVLKGRADKSLEHVFSLLALELPIEPLKVAFRAFHSDDRMLRALAMEYLESKLSGKLVSQLASLAEAAPREAGARNRQEVLDELMASQQSVLLSLKIPSADAPG